MGYWNDWKFPPQWVGENIIAPYARYAVNGTAFWPALGIDSPLRKSRVALKSIPPDTVRGVSWFTYGTGSKRPSIRSSNLLKTSAEARRLFGYGDGTATPSPTASPPTANTIAERRSNRIQPKDFPFDTSVWSIVCLGELYRRGALPEHNIDPVCPVMAFHTFAEARAGTPVFLYKCSTAYLDAFLRAIAAAGFNVTPLSRLQNFLITGDACHVAAATARHHAGRRFAKCLQTLRAARGETSSALHARARHRMAERD